MNKEERNALRNALEQLMKKELKSVGYYSRKMDMTPPTLYAFLDESHLRAPSELTTRKISEYLFLKGIDWKREHNE